MLATRVHKEVHAALWDLASKNRRGFGVQVEIVLEAGLEKLGVKINKEPKTDE